MSRGTAKTIVENLPQGGRIRRDGRIVAVPTAWKTLKVPFHDRPRWTMTIPWGDVASAYHSTGIGNIEVYTAVSRRAATWMKRTRALARLAGLPLAQRLLKSWIDRRIMGPDEQVLLHGRAHLWGRVTDAAGNEVTMKLETHSGYQLTRLTALTAVQKLHARSPGAGFFTPSRAFGPNMILEIPGILAF
jgi:short subunit dehydrogenase-like uncharacterized protein